jgi:hypothetical protein
MSFGLFMTDLITVYSKEWVKKREYYCSFQKRIYFNSIIDDIEEGDYFERKISEKKIEKYKVIEVKYITDPAFTSTQIFYEKFDWLHKKSNDNGKVVIQNSIIQWSNIGWSGNKVEININNEIDQILELIDKLEIKNKEEIRILLKEIQTETDEKKKKFKWEKVLWMLGNWATVGQLIVAIWGLIRQSNF